jgi:hypothetical protein
MLTDTWPSIKDVPEIDVTDYCPKCSCKLQKIVTCTSGLLQKLLVSVLVILPYTVTARNVTSQHNRMTSSMSLREESTSTRLFVSLNGVGTANLRRRWVDNIKMDLREIGRRGVDRIDLAQDRD